MSKGTAATLEHGEAWRADTRWRVKLSWLLSVTAVKKLLAFCFGKDVFALNVLAFLLGRVAITGELIPFGLAYFIAVARNARVYSLTVAIWAIAGSVSAGYTLEAVWYAAVMAGYYYLSGRQSRFLRQLSAVPFIIATCVALAGVCMLLWQYITLYQLMLIGFNIGACLALAAISVNALPLFGHTRLKEAREEQVVCLVVILAAAIAGIGQTQVLGYSVRNAISSFFIMAMALRGGAGLGVCVGAAVGVIVGLNDGSGAMPVAYYTVAAFLGGAFSGMGKFAIALGYLAGSVIALAYFTAAESMLNVLAESAAGGLLFMAIPGSWQNVWRKRLPVTNRQTVVADSGRPAADVKLRRIAELFSDLAGAFARTEATAEVADDIKQDVDRLGRQVCKTCNNREYCWEQQFYATYQAFLDILAVTPSEKLSVKSLSAQLRESCQRQQELIAAAAEIAEQKRAQFYWQKKTLEFRSLLAEQMRSAGAVVATLADEVQPAPKHDRQVELKLNQVLRHNNYEVDELAVTGQGSDLWIACRKNPCGGDQECATRMVPMIAEAVGKRLTVESHCGSKALRRKCRLVFKNSVRYAVAVGAAARPKGAKGVCGDTCLVTDAGQGRVAAIISDGMGSGEVAASESQAAVYFLERLLAAEFSLEAAVKVVNAMLLLRTPNECYTTIDVAVFDLIGGEVEFLKTGSAASFIKRVREVSVIQSTSLPVGIIEHVEIEPQRKKLAAGDTIVMVSDGVAEADRQRLRRDWLANFLRLAPDDDPQELADSIINKAQQLSGAAIHDDMTVLVIKIHECLGSL